MIYYFDNCATTRTDDDVTTILDTFAKETYYNPSARSTFSLQVSNKLNEAREQIAKLVGADPSEIYFTSGGTESDNIAIFGSAKPKSGNIVVTASEHSAVYNAVMQLGSKGYEVRLTKVTDDGHIDVADFLSKVENGIGVLYACQQRNRRNKRCQANQCLGKGKKSSHSHVIRRSASGWQSPRQFAQPRRGLLLHVGTQNPRKQRHGISLRKKGRALYTDSVRRRTGKRHA